MYVQSRKVDTIRLRIVGLDKSRDPDIYIPTPNLMRRSQHAKAVVKRVIVKQVFHCL